LIKDKLRNGDFVMGTWCEIPSPNVINVIAKAGLDFVIIDMEHGAMDYKVAQEMVMAAEADGCEGIIRVPQNDESSILRALDVGASGVIVPHVESREDVKKIVEYSKFFPVGKRGFNPYIRAGNYNSGNKDLFRMQNEKTLIAIIVEGRDGLKNFDEILSEEELDVVYIGTYDLSVALEVPGDVKNPKVLEVLEELVSKTRKKGKVAGCMIHDLKDLDEFKRMGIQFVLYKTDTAIIYDTFHEMQKELK